MSRLSPGQVIAGKLRVVEPLGSGAMGTVYAVEHLTLRNRQAMKVLSPELARRPEQVERFLREGVAITRVRHRAVVQVFDAGVDSDTPWIAMELLEGETLANRLQRGGVSASEAVQIAMEILGGLAASHAQGIVHRDLKPSNVILARQPDGSVQPKILDFGVARLLDTNDRITAVGTTMGSIQYMAPEQIHASHDVDARADIYAVGAILYEALSGRTPYRASNIAELLSELAYSPPPDLRMASPDQPPWLTAIVNQCLARERGRRPSDARAVLSVLASHYASLPAPSLGSTLRMKDALGSASSAGGRQSARTEAWAGAHTPASQPGYASQPSAHAYGSQPGAQGSQPGSAQVSWQGSDPAVLFAAPKPSPLRHLLWIAPIVGLACVSSGVVAYVVLGEEDERAPAPITTSADPNPVPTVPVQQPPSNLGPAMMPIAPGTPPAAPPVVPALAPTPVLVTAHPCRGRWRGSLYQSDGQRGTCTVDVNGTEGQCGGFVERWDSGDVCHYRLRNCSASDGVVTASASTPAHEQCTPARMRFTCQGDQLRFHEAAGGVTVTSTMSRVD